MQIAPIIYYTLLSMIFSTESSKKLEVPLKSSEYRLRPDDIHCRSFLINLMLTYIFRVKEGSWHPETA